MPAIASPYCAAVYAAVEPWLEFVAESYDRADTVADCDALARAAIARLERCNAIDSAAARLLLETFDLLPLDMA